MSSLLLPRLNSEGEELGAVEGVLGRIAVRRIAIIDGPDVLELIAERRGKPSQRIRLSMATAVGVSVMLQVAVKKLGSGGA